MSKRSKKGNLKGGVGQKGLRQSGVFVVFFRLAKEPKEEAGAPRFLFNLLRRHTEVGAPKGVDSEPWRLASRIPNLEHVVANGATLKMPRPQIEEDGCYQVLLSDAKPSLDLVERAATDLFKKVHNCYIVLDYWDPTQEKAAASAPPAPALEPGQAPEAGQVWTTSKSRTQFVKAGLQEEGEVLIRGWEPSMGWTWKHALVRHHDSKRKEKASVPQMASRLKRLLHGVGTGLLLAALGAVLVEPFLEERSPAGGWGEQLAYAQMAGNLPVSRENLPVVVADFGENLNYPGEIYTNLRQLDTAVGEILKHKPLAVAVDFDFGPDLTDSKYREDEYRTDAEPLRRRAVQSLLSGTPIFLGTTLLAPGAPELLGSEETVPVAVHVLRTPGIEMGQKEMLGSIRSDDAELPSLAEKLSEQYRSKHKTAVVSQGFSWLIERYEHGGRFVDLSKGVAKELEAEVADLRATSYLVNYQSLGAIERNSVKILAGGKIEAGPNPDERIQGKLIIVGSTTSVDDQMRQPGSFRPVAGVTLHALAVDTLLRNPVYMLTHTGNIFSGLALAILVLGFVTARKYGRLDEPSDSRYNRAAFVSPTVLTLLGIAALTVASARLWGVLWTGGVVSLLSALAIEPRIDAGVEWIEEWIKRLGDSHEDF